ncbi:MAG TPA: hypothetical protein VMT11_10845 [Myxococcaceae bacterium]|nr:hypothetical protein [Myxococcaceae bacterium]
MSIWTELLFLHGHLARVPGADGAADPPGRTDSAEAAARLRESIGCPGASTRRPEPRGPLLGVRGLA